MTSTTGPLLVSEPFAASRPRNNERFAIRLAVASVALVGAAATGYGVSLPWLSTFAGLISQNGWGTRNGMILFWLAIVAALLAGAQVFAASPTLRWMLALSGFAIAGFAGYLLIQLYSVTQQLDGMVLASKRPGLFVATAGGVAVFATIFAPMPSASMPQAVVVGSRPPRSPSGLVRFLARPLDSAFRYPAAALAVTAGLAHVPVTPEHLQEAPYIGVLFIVLTVVCVLGAATLLIADSTAAWLLVGGSCALAVLAYVISRTVGLPLMADDIGNWLEPLGVVSVVTESGAALLATLAVRRGLRAGRATAQPS